MAHLRAGIAGVDIEVYQAVEGHRRRARTHHGRHDPQQFLADFTRGVSAVPKRQQRARESERQGENRVLELDHVERELQTLQQHWGSTSILPPVFSRPPVLGKITNTPTVFPW